MIIDDGGDDDSSAAASSSSYNGSTQKSNNPISEKSDKSDKSGSYYIVSSSNNHDLSTALLSSSDHNSNSNSNSNSMNIKDEEEGAGGGLRDSIFSQRFSMFVNPNNSANLTTFLLLNTMIGSGILNQPYVFKMSGIWGGIAGYVGLFNIGYTYLGYGRSIVMVVSGVLIWTGLLCLTAAGIETNTLEYSGLAKKAFGVKGERVVDLAIIIVTFGSQLGYILIIGTSLSDLLYQWGCRSVICDDFAITILSIGIFTGPVCFYKHFGHLAYLSVFSIAAIVAVLFLVLIGGPIKHQTNGVGNDDYRLFNTLGMLQSLGSIVFSLDCASANLQAFIATESKSQVLPVWKKISGSAVIMGGAMCIVMGIAGYLSFGSGTQGMILDNFNAPGFDVFKVLVVVHLILYIPSNFVIMRYSVVKLFSGKRSEKLDSYTHAVVTVFLLSLTVAVVLLILSLNLGNGAAFSLILNITGGVGGGLEAFILPAAIYLKLMSRDSALFRPAICLLFFGILVMLSVVLSTIIDF